MEGIYFETLAVEFGVAFTCVLVLIAIVAGLLLAGMAEAERAGTRLLWAEWPIAGTEIVPPARERVRLAA
jgi:hypothetical protein